MKKSRFFGPVSCFINGLTPFYPVQTPRGPRADPFPSPLPRLPFAKLGVGTLSRLREREGPAEAWAKAGG